MRLSAQRKEIGNACRRMHRDRLVVGTSGNISVRVDDLVAITPSGTDYETLAAEDVLVVGLDGTVVCGEHLPSSELPMHLAVYAATDARSIVHTHSLFATSVGTVCDELPAVHYAINALGGPVRVAPYATFGSDELAAGVAAALHERTGALMRNHGAITIGPTLAAAYDRAVKLEWLSELYWRAMLLGTPSVLSTDELSAVRDQARRKAYRP
ncbi:MAG: L-fuculose-phosphate aldolase [Dactylosporangium sp.]|jgi:L-fuculose-phosphate aldolase|nr:L-fuculose-phosphate aldolase [Dactylosporangium sp.]